MSHQEALTIVASVDPSRLTALTATLATMSLDPAGNAWIPFGRLPRCHFGRLFTWGAMKEQAGGELPPQLLLTADFDGPAESFLRELVELAGAGIDGLFEHCLDYPVGNATAATRLAYLQRHRVRERAFYVHRPGRTVQQILQEAELRVNVDQFLSKLNSDALSAREVRQRVYEFVRTHPRLSALVEPPEGIDWRHRVHEAIDRIARPLLLCLFAPLLSPISSAAVLLIRLQELKERPKRERPDAEHLSRLTALEDFAAHNAYAAGGFIKPGRLRFAAIYSLLGLVDYGVRHLFNEDSLAGIKTIHFARWIPMTGRRLLFTSNFDGSVESYNDDFINLLGWGLNLVFSNGEGYPPTRWLIFGGANYEQHFKDHLRRRQVPVPVSYSAYPTLTARNIENNAVLRAGLCGDMSEEEAQVWLRLR